MRTDEASEKSVIQLLTNFINRSVKDTEAVKVDVKTAKSLKGALVDLAKFIYDPIDTFTTMQDLVKLQWQPGQDIGDCYFLERRKAAHAGTTLKFVASMVSHNFRKMSKIGSRELLMT